MIKKQNMSRKGNIKCEQVKEDTSSQSAASIMMKVEWDMVRVLADIVVWEQWAVRNTVKLLDDDNTVPFIARYRKEQTNNMEADKVREVKTHLDELRAVEAKVASVLKTLNQQGLLTLDLSQTLRHAQTLEEIEHLYAPFKPGSKRTLAQRARDAGLEPITLAIIKNPHSVNLQSVVKPGTEGVSSLREVEKGVQHILADIISKDKQVMDRARHLVRTELVWITCTQSKTSSKTSNKTKPAKKGAPSHKTVDASKFENYFNFRCSVKTVKSHQVLAINRGEKLKVLSVKVVLPKNIMYQIIDVALEKFTQKNCPKLVISLMKTSAEDAYSRLVEPLMIRNIRAGLTKTAELASVEVFKSNLKSLLLTPPVRGRVVLGLDPGFRNGCKFAVTSKSGEVLDSGVLYLHNNSSHGEINKLHSCLLKNNCQSIALGNGVACRETESLLSQHIEKRTFKPLNPMYCIVSEAGASIYSASDEAMKELPQLDITLRGAVSIARRLQDPLAELVKIEPRHIGVGMYQHDVNENILKTALEGVVEDCVSFVGVDINVSSDLLLRRVAGLNKATAERIVQWRHEHGSFINREQLKLIKGLGPKTFKQCSGFIRVRPETSGRQSSISGDTAADDVTSNRKRKTTTSKPRAAKKAKVAENLAPNPLDCTNIHPESYPVVDRLLDDLKLEKEEIGTDSFIATVKMSLQSKDVDDLARQYDVGSATMQLIIRGLQQSLHADLRDEFEKPLFKQGVTSLSALRTGSVLTGKVSNVTHFGAFVDAGVERDGLIHSSKMHRHLLRGKGSLQLGDRVKVKVLSIDMARGRLSLELIEVM